ncbi:hypothetical protein [Stutzerimonas degradans]|uniref:hypothetical protein n=1 Tax=Stutzerimonas degradans TaxID=2968968 RepID=UPI0011AEE08E|nr:hypothetical protein [Stutzerimonas degradans]MCQ4276963.1 hypothetical protein [Stutzerimonas degradans]QPT23008.1 hypothetical protein I6G33_07035 [Stutzerimonas degradans]
MKIQKDIDQIQNELQRAKRHWNRTSEQVVNYFEHWESLSKQTLNDLVQFNPRESKETLTGSILNKRFRIHFTPLLKNGSIYAETIIEVFFSSQEQTIESGRIWIDKDGRIFDTNMTPLITDFDDMPGYSLLCNILLSTLQTEAPQS